MSRSAITQLYVLGVMALIVGIGVMRRVRPQPVRPTRLMVSGAVVAVAVGLGLVGTGGQIMADRVALVLIPVFVAAGVALGYFLVRTMTFWADPATGALWMKGGALFALILVGSILLRLGVRSLATGSLLGPSGGLSTTPHGLLYDLSGDLLFLTLGLWASRAYLLVQRHRSHVAARG